MIKLMEGKDIDLEKLGNTTKDWKFAATTNAYKPPS
jgi:hypothetical protein